MDKWVTLEPVKLYGQLTSEVVGIRHYRGLVGPGEEVLLMREPQNAYDR